MREKVDSRQERDQRQGNNLGGGNQQVHQNSQKSRGPGGSGDGPAGGGYSNAPITLPDLQKLLEQKSDTERHLENIKTPYEKYYSQLAPYADEFSGELRNILKENSEMKYVGDFRSGRKLNMRKAMSSSAQFERTGQYDDEIWLRRHDPTKRTYDFVFILDESGSMLCDERWDNLLKGMIMSAEALEQLKVNFAVIGYSDDPVIHKTFDDKYDTRFREQMLAGIQQAPHANNNEHDALHACMQMLEKRPSENQKIVIFITDGLTEASQVTDGLKRAEELGARMIGVGIGPAMAEVKGLFPESLVAERVQTLPFMLADEIRKQIIGGLDDARRQR
jgi:midasin (ATPase involved in ribosome maturation)